MTRLSAWVDVDSACLRSDIFPRSAFAWRIALHRAPFETCGSFARDANRLWFCKTRTRFFSLLERSFFLAQKEILERGDCFRRPHPLAKERIFLIDYSDQVLGAQL